MDSMDESFLQSLQKISNQKNSQGTGGEGQEENVIEGQDEMLLLRIQELEKQLRDAKDYIKRLVEQHKHELDEKRASWKKTAKMWLDTETANLNKEKARLENENQKLTEEKNLLLAQKSELEEPIAKLHQEEASKANIQASVKLADPPEEHIMNVADAIINFWKEQRILFQEFAISGTGGNLVTTENPQTYELDSDITRDVLMRRVASTPEDNQKHGTRHRLGEANIVRRKDHSQLNEPVSNIESLHQEVLTVAKQDNDRQFTERAAVVKVDPKIEHPRYVKVSESTYIRRQSNTPIDSEVAKVTKLVNVRDRTSKWHSPVSTSTDTTPTSTPAPKPVALHTVPAVSHDSTSSLKMSLSQLPFKEKRKLFNKE